MNCACGFLFSRNRSLSDDAAFLRFVPARACHTGGVQGTNYNSNTACRVYAERAELNYESHFAVPKRRLDKASWGVLVYIWSGLPHGMVWEGEGVGGNDRVESQPFAISTMPTVTVIGCLEGAIFVTVVTFGV